MTTKRELGDRCERIAESFLHDQGLKTITRNFQCRLGEIDLVMEDGGCLVFTEVRYRKSGYFGSGAESVTKAKQNRIIRAAQRYLQCHGRRSRQACRFDVVSLGRERGTLTVNWIRDAFTVG